MPLVAPEVWGFTRYGKDNFIPSPLTHDDQLYEKQKAVMLEQLQKMGGYKSYDIDDFHMKKLIIKLYPKEIPIDAIPISVNFVEDANVDTTQSEFLDRFVSTLAQKYMKDRTNYVANYQIGMRDICGIYFGTSTIKKTSY